MKKTKLSDILGVINRFKLSAFDKLTGTNYSGAGTVEVHQNDNTIDLRGSGSWNDALKNSSQFSFAYKLSIHSEDELSIKHTRYGESNAVYLCKLIRISEHKFASTEPHNCNDDLYSVELLLNDNTLELNWEITGPKKDMVLEYNFS